LPPRRPNCASPVVGNARPPVGFETSKRRGSTKCLYIDRTSQILSPRHCPTTHKRLLDFRHRLTRPASYGPRAARLRHGQNPADRRWQPAGSRFFVQLARTRVRLLPFLACRRVKIATVDRTTCRARGCDRKWRLGADPIATFRVRRHKAGSAGRRDREPRYCACWRALPTP
jgi:hypothetical protein